VEQHPEQPDSPPASAVPAKGRPYSKPTLTKYGDVADLTKGSFGPTQDMVDTGSVPV
jgi:hypothetical protein